jgi:hypothetical protein
VAVLSSHPRFHEESPCHHLEGTELHQNDEAYFSMNKDVSKRWTVPLAPSPYTQVKDIPVSQDQTQSQTRYKSLYGPQVAVLSIHPRFPRESFHSRHLDGVESCWNDESSFSVKKNVSERRAVTQALPSYMKVNISPVSQVLMRPHMHYESSYRPQLAVSPSHQ